MGKPEEKYLWTFDVCGVRYNVAADTEKEAYDKIGSSGQRVTGTAKLTDVTERTLLTSPGVSEELQERMVGAIENMCGAMKAGMDAEPKE